VIAVLLRSDHGPTAYPFDDEDRPIAGRFAKFLNAEVGPAAVIPFETVGPDARVVWLSPLSELLTWYENEKRRAVTQ
jgi:hypothetical protein